MKEFTKNDVIRSMYDDAPDDTNEGFVCVIPLDKLSLAYSKPEYQLFRVKDGFGVHPSKSGNACYGHFCFDGEECRWEKFKFIGVGSDEVQRLGAEMEKVREVSA